VADRGTLPTAVHQLLKHGRPPEEPAAVIRNATTNRQQTVTGRLSSIGSIAEAAGVDGDCLFVVGDTAGFRDRLNWFEERPLFGYRVALTDLEDRAREQALCLEEEGAVVSVVPLLGVAPLPDAKEALLEAAEQFHQFDFVVFTSPVTVRIFFEVLWEEGKDPRRLSGPRIVAMFPATAAELGRYGLQPDVLMEELPSRDLASRLGMEEGHRVLLPRPARARDLLPLQLREQGAQVEIIPVYDTIPNEEGMERLRRLILDGSLDLAVYSSSSGFESFWECLDAAERSVCLSQVAHACTGSLVARGLASKGIKPCFELQDPNPGDLREAVLACRAGGESEEESVPPPGQPEKHE
jgi:uroporphyrinogen III methyltransferase/synthase